MSPILTARGLSFQNKLFYPDVDIQKGSAAFISGRSGSGKTTLLRFFNGTLAPSSGQVFYDGQDIAAMDTLRLRRRLILAMQTVYLFSGTILENFSLFHEYHESPVPPAEELAELLEICRMDFPLEALCDSMSAGERQRVFLAVALSMAPETLMLDEPTSALDAPTAEKVMENIMKFSKERGITLVAVSHDKALLERHAEKIITIGGETK